MDSLKSALSFLFQIVIDLDKALEDGKINFFTEGISLATKLVGIPSFIADIKASWGEIKELIGDEAKREELITYFEAEFELSNEKAETVVEKVIDAVITIAGSVDSVIKAVKG